MTDVRTAPAPAKKSEPIKAGREDLELQRYRNLLQTPTEFREGFGWSTLVGVLFCGLVMMPGSVYLGLMTGGSISTAATWVTVILFAEIMRRALKNPTKQELVVLLYAAGAMATGGVFAQCVYRAYVVTSTPVRDAGMREAFPTWWVPAPTSEAILTRNLLHPDWLAPIGLLAVVAILHFVNKWTLGYVFFRLTSDGEKLPFPLAPIGAQGAMAMAEAEEPALLKKSPAELLRPGGAPRATSERWRLFTLGVLFGTVFGMVQVGVPAITGLFLDRPIFLIPQPWVDTTTWTQGLLPATPTGVMLDAGIILIGMVLPFWAVVGTAIAILLTLAVNPLLQTTGVLGRWQPGMDTINTTFANRVDFWLSFTIGTGVGIAAVSLFQTGRDFYKQAKAAKARREASRANGTSEANVERGALAAPPGRGDYPLWMAIVGYVVVSAATIGLCCYLLPVTTTALIFMVLFAFVYSPLLSYVNARLLGLTGQTVEIPFIREIAFILSGVKGVGIWLAPIGGENVGPMAQQFRVNELTGVKFTSLLKTDLIVIPASFVLSFVFWAFIWASDPIPSAAFPAAQVQWDLQAREAVLLYSSTFSTTGEGGASQSAFMQAIHPTAIASGFGITILLFAVTSILGLPTMLVYGMIRGLGGIPHTMVLELVGAGLSRFYFQKKFGADNFLRIVPTVIAGYFTGVGLVGMATISLRFIQSAVSGAPF